WMNRGDRVEAPLVKRGAGELQAVDWDEALQRTARVLRGAGGRAVVLASPKMSTEALFLTRELCAGLDWTGAVQIVMGEAAPLAALGRGESLAGPDAAFDRLARSVGPFAGLSYASLGALGKPINAGVGAGATA